MARSAPPAAGERWLALDALRGIAALAVVLYHLRWAWHGADLVHVRHAFYAVDFFFVLSGFVMAANYGALQTWPAFARFLVKRAGRLLPLHFAVLLGFVAVEIAVSLLDRSGLPSGRPTFSGFTSLRPLLAQATMLFGLIPSLDWLWNHPCWSIAVEFWTYVLFGLTLVVCGRSLARVWVGLSCLGLTVMAAFTPEGLAVTSGNAIFRCLLSFFLGTLTFVAYRWLRERGVRIGTRAQAGALCLALVLVALPASSGWSLVIPYAFALVIVCLAFEGGGVARALCARPLLRLGELSFSIYLVHVPVWFALENLLRLGAQGGQVWLLPDAGPSIPVLVSPFGSALATDALILGYVGLVLVVSAWTHRWIEVPARLWSRNLAEQITRPRTRIVSVEA